MQHYLFIENLMYIGRQIHASKKDKYGFPVGPRAYNKYTHEYSCAAWSKCKKDLRAAVLWWSS